MRRGVRAGRRSSPAKRVYGLKPVSRVQISPSPPGICLLGRKSGTHCLAMHAALSFGRSGGNWQESAISGLRNRGLAAKQDTHRFELCDPALGEELIRRWRVVHGGKELNALSRRKRNNLCRLILRMPFH